MVIILQITYVCSPDERELKNDYTKKNLLGFEKGRMIQTLKVLCKEVLSNGYNRGSDLCCFGYESDKICES